MVKAYQLTASRFGRVVVALYSFLRSILSFRSLLIVFILQGFVVVVFVAVAVLVVMLYFCKGFGGCGCC